MSAVATHSGTASHARRNCREEHCRTPTFRRVPSPSARPETAGNHRCRHHSVRRSLASGLWRTSPRRRRHRRVADGRRHRRSTSPSRDRRRCRSARRRCRCRRCLPAFSRGRTASPGTTGTASCLRGRRRRRRRPSLIARFRRSLTACFDTRRTRSWSAVVIQHRTRPCRTSSPPPPPLTLPPSTLPFRPVSRRRSADPATYQRRRRPSVAHPRHHRRTGRPSNDTPSKLLPVSLSVQVNSVQLFIYLIILSFCGLIHC